MSPRSLQHVGRILWSRDWSAVAQHDHIGSNTPGRSGASVDQFDAVVERERRLGADAPARGETHVTHDDVGAGLGHRHRTVLVEHIRRRQQVEVAGDGDHVDLVVVAHARLFEILSKHTVDQSDRREVLHSGKANPLQLRQEDLRHVERIGGIDAGQHRRVLHHRQHFAGHVDDDLVGIAVRQESGERTPSGHAVATGVVDHDQIDAAGLLPFGRQPGAGSPAHDGHASVDHVAESGRDIPCVMGPSRRSTGDLVECSECCGAKLRMVDRVRNADDLPLLGLVDLGLDRCEQRFVGLGIEERLSGSIEQRDTTLRQQETNRPLALDSTSRR